MPDKGTQKLGNSVHGEYEFCHQLTEYEGQNYTGGYNGKSLDGLWKFTKMWDYVSFLNGDTH